MGRTRRTHVLETERSDKIDDPGVAVIGLGAVGSSLVRSLHRTRYRLLALINRSVEVAVALAADTGAPIASSSVHDIPTEAKLLFICTREDVIPTIVDELLRTGVDFERAVVAHVSGRQTASILSPLAERGALTMSFHPLGSFPTGRIDKTFQGLSIGLEGNPEAVAVGAVLAQDLGGLPVEVSRDAKAAYHLAASVTSNYLVTLLSDVQRILSAAGLPPHLTQSLAADTLLNLGSLEPELALTGPIVRADAEGLSSQIETLASVAPELLSRYIALADGTIDLALRSGRITSEESSKLRRVLKDAPVEHARG